MSTIIKQSMYAANQKPWNIQKSLDKNSNSCLDDAKSKKLWQASTSSFRMKTYFFRETKKYFCFFFFVWKTHYKIDISWCVFLAKQGHKCILVSVDFNITNKKIGASHRGKCNSCKPLEVLKVVWWFLTLKYMNKTIS